MSYLPIGFVLHDVVFDDTLYLIFPHDSSYTSCLMIRCILSLLGYVGQIVNVDVEEKWC